MKVAVLLFRWIQFLGLCGTVWFGGWAFIYEVVFWHKPLWDALGSSFVNILAFTLSIMLIGFVELNVRNFSSPRRRRRKTVSQRQAASLKRDSFTGFPSVVDVEEKRKKWTP